MAQGIPPILYRWITDADVAAFGRGLTSVGVRSIGIPPRPDVIASIQTGFYVIAPQGTEMTVREYLSPTKGVGGNVVGFFEYIEHWDKGRKDRNPGYNDISTTKFVFGRGRHLLIIPMAHYKGPPIIYAGAALEDKIVPCPGFLKIAKLGGLMETRVAYGQEAEWNFIPGEPMGLPAFIVTTGTGSDKAFYIDGTLDQYVDMNKLLGVAKEIVDSQSTKVAPKIIGQVNIDQCPVRKGGRRTRKRTSRKKRTYRNMLPKVVGSYTWGR